MHKAVGLDGRRDPHRVLKVLQEIDADIVALQEADKRVGGRGSTVPHELIDSHGMYKPVHLGVRHKRPDRKSTRLNSSHPSISYAVFCLKKKKQTPTTGSCSAFLRFSSPTRSPHCLLYPASSSNCYTPSTQAFVQVDCAVTPK